MKLSKIIQDYINKTSKANYQYEKVTIRNSELKILINAIDKLNRDITIKSMVDAGLILNNHEKIKFGIRIGK